VFNGEYTTINCIIADINKEENKNLFLLIENLKFSDFNPATFKKYNPEAPTKIKVYAFFQFFALSYVGLVLLESGDLNYQQLWVTISMMAFTMYCTSLWLDGKEGFAMEVTRLALCLMIGIYAYLEISLAQIATSLMIYSFLNILVLPWINRPQVIPEA